MTQAKAAPNGTLLDSSQHVSRLYSVRHASLLRCQSDSAECRPSSIYNNVLREFPERFWRVTTIINLWPSYRLVQATAGVGTLLIRDLI